MCGFSPITITQSHEVLSNALKNVADVSKWNYEGVRILGIHFEGPYLDKDHKGAQLEDMDLISGHSGFSKRYGFVYVNRDEQDLKDPPRKKKKSFYCSK